MLHLQRLVLKLHTLKLLFGLDLFLALAALNCVKLVLSGALVTGLCKLCATPHAEIAINLVLSLALRARNFVSVIAIL